MGFLAGLGREDLKQFNRKLCKDPDFKIKIENVLCRKLSSFLVPLGFALQVLTHLKNTNVSKLHLLSN